MQSPLLALAAPTKLLHAQVHAPSRVWKGASLSQGGIVGICRVFLSLRVSSCSFCVFEDPWACSQNLQVQEQIDPWFSSHGPWVAWHVSASVSSHMMGRIQIPASQNCEQDTKCIPLLSPPLSSLLLSFSFVYLSLSLTNEWMIPEI